MLFLFGLSLSNFTETLKMVFINRLDLPNLIKNKGMEIYHILLRRQKFETELLSGNEVASLLHESIFTVMEPALHCDRQTKTLLC